MKIMNNMNGASLFFDKRFGTESRSAPLAFLCEP